MSFRFNPNYTFEWPVTVAQPAQGKMESFAFTGIFRMIDEQDLVRTEEFTTSQDYVNKEVARLRKVFVGFKGIIDDSGGQESELVSSPESIEMLMRNHHVRIAIGEAVRESMFGGGQRTKN